MVKKILKVIGSFFFVAISLFVAVGAWFWLGSEKYQKVAQPFLAESLPKIATWNFEQLKPLLTPEALEEFESERGQKIFKMFSKLGALSSFEEPQFRGAQAGVAVQQGAYNVLHYSVVGHFEKGDANLALTLAEKGDDYLYHQIQINSDVFFE